MMSSREKVLIIEDDDSIREIVRIMLKDYDVIEASNGLDGIRLFLKERPKVVLVDISMPEIDGVEVTREILKADPKAIVIGLTAFARSRGRDLMEAGATCIIEKPFTRKILKEVIEKSLGKIPAKT